VSQELIESSRRDAGSSGASSNRVNRRRVTELAREGGIDAAIKPGRATAEPRRSSASRSRVETARCGLEPDAVGQRGAAADRGVISTRLTNHLNGPRL